jgi:L-erythro-3,5-diaminohexanoate dehydrogenase
MANDPYGLLRVMEPQGTLPQRAEVLDPSLPIRDDELLIDAEHLNVDAASFRQIASAEGGDPERIKAHILALVRRRGKLHNPVTGSGGMLVGRVREVGPNHPARATLSPGDRVATLVSLSLTPLALSEIRAVHPEVERLDVRAHAILFATGLFAKLPEDMPDTLSLAALDVCGAPALTGRLAEPGMRVLVVGAGTSGALCCAQARRSGARQVIALDVSPAALDRFRAAGLATDTVAADATRPVEVLRRVEELTGGALCDLVINCASVPETEVASILSCRQRGAVLFFSMATSFPAVALSAEGVGKDVTLYVGNGYAEGHAQLTLDLLRAEPKLRALFEERYGAAARAARNP